MTAAVRPGRPPTDGGTVTRPDDDLDDLVEAPLGELLARVGEDTSELFSAQVKMAVAEVGQDLRQAGRVGGMFGAAAVAGFLALVLLAFAAAWGLAEVMPEGLAFLIVGAVVAVVAGGVFAIARSRARALDPVPRATVETVKEDVQWLRQQTTRQQTS
jgi:hypothetical protein